MQVSECVLDVVFDFRPLSCWKRVPGTWVDWRGVSSIVLAQDQHHYVNAPIKICQLSVGEARSDVPFLARLKTTSKTHSLTGVASSAPKSQPETQITNPEPYKL